MNKFVFPATREMFLRDVAAFAAGIQVTPADPGDVVEVRHGETTLKKRACPFVRTVRDDVEDTAFDSTGSVPELIDFNPANYSNAEMLGAIEKFFEGTLMPALRRSVEERRICYEYQQLGLIYQLDVVFPAGVRTWSIDFADDLAVKKVACPLGRFRSRITASVLIDLIEGRCSLNYLYGSGLYRTWERIYCSGPHGQYKWTSAIEEYNLDPLWIALDPQTLFARYVERELARIGA